MEDLGDLLYIVIAVIGVVYSIIKKSNKAKQSTPPIMENDEVEQPFETHEPTFERVFESGVEPKPVVVQESRGQKKSDLTIEEKKKQIERNFAKFKSTKDSVEESNNKELDVLQPTLNFNLRQAVIYSEILKRPEY